MSNPESAGVIGELASPAYNAPAPPQNEVNQTPVDTLTGNPIAGPDAAGITGAQIPQQPTTSFDPSNPNGSPTPQNINPVAPPGSQQEATGQNVPITPDALSQRANQLVHLYPSLKQQPAVVAALAGLPITDDDLFGSVGQTITAGQAQTQAAVLTDMTDPSARWTRWQSYSKEAQQAILNTGMPAPVQPKPTHHGFWDAISNFNIVTTPFKWGGDVIHDIGQATQGVVNAVGTDVAQPLGLGTAYNDTIKPLARAPGNLMQLPGHVYRAMDIGLKGGGISPTDQSLSTGGGNILTHAFDPSWISRAWEATAPGKPFYRQEDWQKAQDAVGGNQQKLDLAIAISQAGGDPAQGVQKLMGPAPAAGPTPDYSTRAGQLLGLAQSDPAVAKAAQILTRAGVSFGRDGARDMGMQEGTLPYMVSSGAMDAAFQWYLNPLAAANRVTSVLKAARGLTADNMALATQAARLSDESNALATAGDTRDPSYFRRLATLGLGPNPGSTVGAVMSNPGSAARAVGDTVARRRFLVMMADHINDGNAAGFINSRPQNANAYNSFLNYVNGYLKPVEGADYQVKPNDVLDWIDQGLGKAAIAKGQFASYLSPNDIELPRLSKTGAMAVWSKVHATPVGLLSENPEIGLNPSDVMPNQGHLAQIGSLLGNMPYKAHQLLTSPIHEGKVELVGENALPSFSRYVRQYLLPSQARDTLINTFADATTTAARRDIVNQATGAGMRRLGFDATEPGQQWIERFQSGSRENYDPVGRDQLPTGHKATTLPDLEEAGAMDTPNLAELSKAAREANVLGVVRGGLTNPVFETIMHKYWAPAALLRLGFVPRLISEEWLTALMRLNPSQIAEGYAGTWLPRIANRMDAYSNVAGDTPLSKFGGILAARAAGVSKDMMLHYFSPELGKASEMVYGARTLNQQARDSVNLVGKLAKQKADLANRLTEGHPEVAAKQQDLDKAMETMRQVMDRASRNPILQMAYGHLFSTGGGFLHSVSTDGALGSVDGEYRPVAKVAMRGYYRSIGRTMDDTDPAFMASAAEYLAKFGRSGVGRAGLEAVRGYGGDARSMTSLRGAYGNTPLAQAPKLAEGEEAPKVPLTKDQQLLVNLRQAFHDAPPEVQDAIRFYRRAVAAGSPGDAAQVAAGGQLRTYHILSDPNFVREDNSAIDPNDIYELKPGTRTLIDGILGKGNYKPVVKRMPDEELGNIRDHNLRDMIDHWRKTRSQNVKNRLALEIKALDPERVAHIPPEAGPVMDAEPIASMFAPPDAEVITSPERFATVAERGMARYMHSPAFAPYVPGSDWLQLDLAHEVPKGHQRLYYPAADVNWSPGRLDPQALADLYPQTAKDVATTVLNRRQDTGRIVTATEGATHQPIGLWAHPNPRRAEAVSQFLAGDQGAIGYVDVPKELADAQRFGQASFEHIPPESAWLRDAKDAKAVTDAVEARIGAEEGSLDGYRLSDDQAANGQLMREGYHLNADGTAANGRTLEENILRLAGKNAQALQDAFLSSGRFLHGPVDDLLRQDPKTLRFNQNHLLGVNPGDLPETISAPVEMQVSQRSLFDRARTFGFEKVIGPSLESMVRSEAFISNLAKSLRAAKVVEPHLVDQDLRALADAYAQSHNVSSNYLRHVMDLVNEHGFIEDGSLEDRILQAMPADVHGNLSRWAEQENRADDHINQIATERAVRDTVPFINDHHAQSNMSWYLGNVSPFLWAQESFLKRWARALRYNPATFERLELTLHGLGSIGMIHKDQYGQDAITLPGSGALTHLMGSLGLPYEMAASVPFTMEVKNLTPGFARPTVPAAGPAVTVPLAYLMGSQPEAKTIGGSLGIPASAKSGLGGAFDQLVPAGWARNLYSALVSSPDSQQWASARLEAMQMLAASGHAPTPGADAAQLQTWQNQVAKWTRNVYILRGALGFLTPATPTFDDSTVKTLDGAVGKLHADLSSLISMFGVSEGITQFMHMHPDAGAYTVFATSSAGGETAPATAPAMNMLASHQSFFDAHPYAGAYFLPQAPGNFDRDAYSQELADGIRVRKGWNTLATEIVNAAASEKYYYYHDQYLQALAATANDATQRSQVEQGWSQWSKSFEAANPLFTEQLNSGTGQAQRGNAIDDLRNALQGDTPNPTAAKALGGMLQLYDYWVQAHDQLAGTTTSAATDQRKQIDSMFANLAAQYVQSNPLALEFYQRTIVPEIAQQDRSLGQSLQVSANQPAA